MLPRMCTTTRVAKKPRQLFLYPRPKFFTFFANRMTTFRNGRLQGRCAAVLPRQDRRARGSLCKFPGSMRSVISNPDTVYMGPFFTVVVAEGKASLSFISFLTQILELTETTNQSQSVFIEKGRYSSISLFCFHTTVRGICIVPFPTITNHY